MVPALTARILTALAALSPSLATAAAQPQPPASDAGGPIPAAGIAAALVAATLVILAVVLRAVVRRRRGPPPLARVLLAGSLYEANLPRSRRYHGEA